LAKQTQLAIRHTLSAFSISFRSESESFSSSAAWCPRWDIFFHVR
jgi:hypothetical protein